METIRIEIVARRDSLGNMAQFIDIYKEISQAGRSGGYTHLPDKSIGWERPTCDGAVIDSQGVFQRLAHPFRPVDAGRPKKETAAAAGSRRGGKFDVNEFNIRSKEYLAERLDAIAIAIDPAAADLDSIAEIIDLADELAGDADLELEPDLEPSLAGVSMRGYDQDLELDDAERDALENPPHLYGGNGETLPDGSSIRRARR